MSSKKSLLNFHGLYTQKKWVVRNPYWIFMVCTQIKFSWFVHQLEKVLGNPYRIFMVCTHKKMSGKKSLLNFHGLYTQKKMSGKKSLLNFHGLYINWKKYLGILTEFSWFVHTKKWVVRNPYWIFMVCTHKKKWVVRNPYWIFMVCTSIGKSTWESSLNFHGLYTN